MISVIMIWIYVLATVFLLGYGCVAVLKKTVHYQIESFLSILMAGIVTATVYAQLFSLFAGVSLGANILMLMFCAGIAVVCRKELFSFFKNKIESVNAINAIIYIVLFVVMAYGTSRGMMHYDTALYHAQSIRWIEEYGVVKGLGNLHCRLAYNSASFALSALYSMRFVTGQSFHTMAGFMVLLLSWECIRLVHVKQRGRLLPSDYARIMAVYYLLMIFDEMVSPASDYFMVITAFFLVIRYLALLEQREEHPEGYALLCLLGVFLMTVKLSAALILLLTIKPAYMLIIKKRWKETVSFVIAGICIVFPYFVRNVLISGWLIYPFTLLDMFDVDWKIPEGIAAYDAREIQVWGRGYTDVLQYDMPMRKWFGSWFAHQTNLDKVFIAASLAAVLIVFVRLSVCIVRRLKNGRWDSSNDGLRFLIVEITLVTSFLFWLMSSPLMRYGCVYVFLTAAVIWGNLFEYIAWKKLMFRKAVYLLLILFGCYKLVMFGTEVTVSFQNAYWICQKDYDNYPVEKYELEGMTFYCAEKGDRTGYDPFPSAPVKSSIILRGSGYEDGFRAVQ